MEMNPFIHGIHAKNRYFSTILSSSPAWVIVILMMIIFI